MNPRAGSLVVVAAMLVGAACSSSPDGEITIRSQAVAEGAEADAYQTLIDRFEAEHPSINVELVAMPGNGDHIDKLTADFAAGTPSDVFLMNYRRFGQFARNGSIEAAGPLLFGGGGGALDETDYYPAALDAFRVDGELMCVPQNAATLAVYWNQRVFEDAGVAPPNPDWTWGEFVATARSLTQDTDGDGTTDIYGIGVATELIRLAPFVWQAGGEVVDDTDAPTRTALLGPDAVRAMAWFIGLRRDAKVAPTPEDAEAEDHETRFARGGLGMLLESRRVVPDLRAVDGLEFDVAPLPRDAERATVLHSDAACIAGGLGDDAKAAAATFVAWAEGEVGQTVLSETGRIVPSLRSVAEGPAFLDGAQPASSQVFLDQLAYARVLPNIAAWNEIESKADPLVEEWFNGLEPPEALGIEIDLATRALFDAEAGP